MMCSGYQGLLLAFVTASVWAVVPDDDDISCIIGHLRCQDNNTCNTLLIEMDGYCDESVATCDTLFKDRCISALLDLQVNPYFRSCTCDPSDHDATHCLAIEKRIFRHECVENEDYPELHWPPRHNIQQGAPSPEELEAIEQSLDRPLSCIGVRSLCLKNIECHEAFKTFQDVCTTKREQEMCTAVDRSACFRAIETIKPTGLFDCKCKDDMKTHTLIKCGKIHRRFVQNPCKVSMPYYIYSAAKYELTYKEYVQATLSNNEQRTFDPENTCSVAFASCSQDKTCALRLKEAVDVCVWDKTLATCDKPACLKAIRDFYLLVRPDKTHALMYCKCQPGDRNCETTRSAIFPTCSVMELPPPSCLNILHRCSSDEDCRTRWQAYRKYCSYDKKAGGCPAGVERCRNAQVGTKGTVLTTNCTCALENEKEQTKCIDARDQLRNDNPCQDMAVEEFHTYRTTTTTHIYPADDPVSSRDCIRELGHKMPGFMSTPAVIRRYHNHSDCSEVCQCDLNGTLRCMPLPCRPNLSCKTTDGVVHTHGSSFYAGDQGRCRCVRAEIVCSKTLTYNKLPEGLFLHVGYSLSDQYLIEGNSNIRFSPTQVADKFGAMLNWDSAEQFCTLTLYKNSEGNMVFEIKISANSPLTEEGCQSPSKMLSNKINDRDPVIVTDAELSIIKVAQLAKIKYYAPTQPSQLVEAYSAAWRIKPSWTLCLILLVVQMICLGDFNGSVQFCDNHVKCSAKEHKRMRNDRWISDSELQPQRSTNGFKRVKNVFEGQIVDINANGS